VKSGQHKTRVIKELTDYAFNAGRFAEKLEAFNRDVERLLQSLNEQGKATEKITENKENE
jgi:hypothetical protein